MEKEVNYGKRKTFYVLNKIWELAKITPEGDLLMYRIENFFNHNDNKKRINPAKEDEILYDIQRWGGLKIDNKERLESEVIYYLKILPKFEKIYLDHESIFAAAKEREKDNSVLVLYLNKTGDLWHDQKNKHCYEMKEKSDRHKIVRHLASNKGYRQTSEISSLFEDKSEQSIRGDIAKIRNNIKKFLHIDGKKFIEGRGGSGYRIGQKYKIKIEKE